MRYFLKTHFHESFYKPFMKRRRHFIDLISIALVTDDDRTYYAVCKDFDVDAAFNSYDLKPNKFYPQMGNADNKVHFIRDTVLTEIYRELVELEDPNGFLGLDSVWGGPRALRELKTLIKHHGKSREQIVSEIWEFISNPFGTLKPHQTSILLNENPPRFYGYYAAYDWIVFCSLFGRMVDLPKQFPQFCIDLKQQMWDHGYSQNWKDENCPSPEHYHALEGAVWNKQLFNTMNSSNLKAPIDLPNSDNIKKTLETNQEG